MVSAFGDAVFDVIEADPSRLREVEGIGRVRAARIAAGWAEQNVVPEIMLFPHAHGVGTSRAVRIYGIYGAEAVASSSENPHWLARDIGGIGFETADQVAAELGNAEDAMARVRPGVSCATAEALDQGHCGPLEDDLRRTGGELPEAVAELIAIAPVLESIEVDRRPTRSRDVGSSSSPGGAMPSGTSRQGLDARWARPLNLPPCSPCRRAAA